MFLKNLTDGYELSNGVKIPCIGFGTWQTPDGDVARESVKMAIAAGYRHIDTAAAYGNETSVGQGILESGIDRESLFVTSKLPNHSHGYDKTRAAFLKTLEDLKTDYVDLYLIHWPNPVAFRDCWEQANAESWKAIEEFYQAGQIRAIGVSNFMERHLEALDKTARVQPMVNQITLSPGLTQDALVRFCRERGMILEAYSPLGTGRVLSNPDMRAIAEKYGRSVAQICVRWSLQMGFLPLPKSTHESRIIENANVFDFELSVDDVQRIASLDCGGFVRDPDTVNL